MEKAKVTKKNILAAIATLANGVDPIPVGEVIVTEEDIVDFVEKTIVQIDNKNMKARERAARAKAEGDFLTKAVEQVLTEDPQSIPQILIALNLDDVTPAKVVSRLTGLIKDGKVEKTEIKDATGRKVKAYGLITD